MVEQFQVTNMKNYLAQAVNTNVIQKDVIVQNPVAYQINYTLITIISLLSIFFIFSALYLFSKKAKTKWRQTVITKLAQLDQLEKSNDIFQLKSAIIEADKLLDYAFKSKRVKGQTMGERLKNAKNLYEWNDYQNIWEGHKLRNKISHEIDFNPSIGELREKYAYLRKAIKKL